MEQFAGNYTGPYWSNGKLQTSVEFGDVEPQSALDQISRMHDTAYAHYPDRAHREAADEIYNRDAKALAGRFPELAGSIVLYGNYASRQAQQLARDVGFSALPGIGTLFGLGKFAVTNFINHNKMLNGTYLKKEKEEIEKLYSNDPILREGQDKIDKFRRAYGKGKEAMNSKSGALSKPIPEEAPRKLDHPVVDRAPKKTQVAPAPTPPVKRLSDDVVRRQAERLEAYNQTYKNAMQPLHLHSKQKRKKKNLKKATQILPGYCIH